MPNHLISEKSPYLQQHAHNPVDWYPWGPEAFEKARREDKPIFLSIGYSTCHWCHVMERESFENEEIAAILNRYFVSIKVDREERPDVDRIYMTFVQATTGSGGWPMSVFLTPSLEPFFGGTYFAPDSRYGRPGFGLILQRIAEAWTGDRDRIDQSSRDVIEHLKRAGTTADGAARLDGGILDSCFHYFRRTFDQTYGGFGEAPKFPRPSVFNFLLRYYHDTRNEEAVEMTLKTLQSMALGGMNDQLGGGFHRYSVDERWFVPHFEKMLYDQAQLAIAYLEAYQITRDEFYSKIARNTLDYVLRDLTSPEGGFYSAEDADSVVDPANPKVKGEGAFYIWSADEIEAILDAEEADAFSRYYGVERSGNVHNDPHGEFTGKNILYVRTPGREGSFAGAREKLLKARNQRPRPHLDDKILTSWNALMISAFAKAAEVLGDDRYLRAADRATEFIFAQLYKEGTVLRRYRDGEAAVNGFLDDYAFLIAALLDLYEADFDPADLDRAVELARKMRELFEDREDGAFFTSAEGDETLVLRMKDDYDGAEPSGNSIALLDLLRLAQITDSDEFRAAADRTLRALSGRMSAQPPAVPQMLVALQFSIARKREVVLVGTREENEPFLSELRARFLPYTVTLLVDSEETREKLSRFISAISGMRQKGAYVCQDYACELPTDDLAKFVELLQ